jgi:hypothetical protein
MTDTTTNTTIHDTKLQFDLEYASTLRTLIELTRKLSSQGMEAVTSTKGTIASVLCSQEDGEIFVLAKALIPFQKRLEAMDDFLEERDWLPAFYAAKTHQEGAAIFMKKCIALDAKLSELDGMD